ncbi:hypothetical protein FEM48_Zijuj07G0163200 [Ziziphus jujuba var. spinosa]|uniref:Uncharacterized protein n=1 Tax=Ziziphus jujuba var. spinosa TaxID=714518 RepID=A0A978V5N6_ZIZJJ|nr:hypothetical protein FEM48_Zijuj07G0163200 [Ziziphus jujuba var. spinosa]
MKKKNVDSKIDKLRKAKHPNSDELITLYCSSFGDHQLSRLLGRLDSKFKAVKSMIEFRTENQEMAREYNSTSKFLKEMPTFGNSLSKPLNCEAFFVMR